MPPFRLLLVLWLLIAVLSGPWLFLGVEYGIEAHKQARERARRTSCVPAFRNFAPGELERWAAKQELRESIRRLGGLRDIHLNTDESSKCTTLESISWRAYYLITLAA
jgi:hypothetical protein